MDELPLVSIITGYYNRTENLKESVQSILDQSYSNFEYIIFDDCSDDGTYELLTQFGDSRVILIRHDKNIGFTKGIIAAIARSKGSLIAIHGAGDISFPSRIEKQVHLLQSDSNIGMVGCLLEDVSSEGGKIHSPIDGNNESHFTQGEVIYRKSLYYEVGGYNSLFRYGQFTLLKREILKISKAAFVDEILYRRIHYGNGVTKNPKRQFEQAFYIKLGQELSNKNSIMEVDVSKVVISAGLAFFSLLDGSVNESLFIFHLKKKKIGYAIFYLYKSKILPKKFTVRLLRKITQ